MAVIKQTSPRQSPQSGGVFDLGDLRVAAQRALGEAREEAVRIVAEARAEAARLQADAARLGADEGRAEGLANGREEGLALGRTEGEAAAKAEFAQRLGAVEVAFATEFARWMAQRDEAMRVAERELAAIAVAIAESIVREHVRADPVSVARATEAAVRLFAQATRVTIEVAREDAEIVAESMPRLAAALPEGAAVSIVARDGMERGGCVIRTTEGGVDARLETQFRRMRDGLLGANGAGEAAPGAPGESDGAGAGA